LQQAACSLLMPGNGRKGGQNRRSSETPIELSIVQLQTVCSVSMLGEQAPARQIAGSDQKYRQAAPT